ncbi:MAG: NAD(P)/FAD-dependent oxidoreductase [Candidatus Saccharibacteria bacterium]|nr:NAD(P)/FAD-dependent oxidoreductase [Candidatus Saccharibacteria bacterium]
MKNRFDYDLAVLGSGDAGGEAALIAAKSGLKVALIESGKWGGSSLNYSNVPFGALFYATQQFKNALNGAKFGLSSTGLRYNYPTINNWKNVALKRAKANSKKDFEEAGISCLHGRGHLLSSTEISVNEQTIRAKKIIIATGASMLDTGIKIPTDIEYWLPENVLEMIRPPKSIFIVGAGSTGCELAQFFATLGTEVIIADIAGRLLPREDEEVGQVLDEIFNKEKIKVLTQSRVIALEKDATSKKVIFLRGGQEKSIRVDQVLMCTGNQPNIDIGLENAGVKFTQRGIDVNEHCRTNVKNIYAAGDVLGGHSSTEKALIEARAAAADILGRGKKAAVDYRGIIRVTNISPAIAEVGITEDDCIRHDSKYNKVIIALDSVQKANTSDNMMGFVKLILAKKSNKILGGTIMAPHAGLIAQELAIAIRYEMTTYELASVPHLANDWSELIRVACEQA